MYRTLLADPPWPYSQQLGRGKSGGDTTRGGLPYRAMTIDEIAALPVGELADEDCMCWLWTTNAHIHYALHVLEAWGFAYKTKCTWAKTGFGLGYWLRGATEDLLLGVRGNPRSKMTGPHGATGTAWSTLIVAPRQDHSRKPQAFMDMVEALGEGPRLELFARQRRLGWDVWGEDVTPGVSLASLVEARGDHGSGNSGRPVPDGQVVPADPLPGLL